MESTQDAPTMEKPIEPKVYTVTVRDMKTKEVISEFSSDILIVAGVMKPATETEQLPVTLFHLGTPMQLNNLLAFVNSNIMPVVLGLIKNSKQEIDMEGKN